VDKQKNEEVHLVSKKAIAMKLVTNRKVRQGAVEFLKNPRADKKTLALKMLSNPKMRQGAVELLKDSNVRSTLVQQATQRLRRP
jgi:hypothetical protein